MKGLTIAGLMTFSFLLTMSAQAGESNGVVGESKPVVEQTKVESAPPVTSDDPAQMLRPELSSTGAAKNEISSQSQPVLKAVAEMGTLPAFVTALKDCPLPGYRGQKMSFFSLKIKNASDQVAIIDADNSQAEVPQAPVAVTDAGAMIKGASQNLTPKGKILVGAVTAGTVGLAGIIFLEHMTPGQHRKRDFGRSCGLDGVRHDVEQSRFGRRLLMPGDETAGWLAFECASADEIKSIKIPIWFAPMQAPPSYLKLPVNQAASL